MKLVVYIISFVLFASNVCPLNFGSIFNNIANQNINLNDVINEVGKIKNQIERNDLSNIIPKSPDDIIKPIENILNNLDPSLVNQLADEIKKTLPIEITNQQLELLLGILNNGNVSFTEKDIVDILNIVLNTNQTNYNQLINHLVDKYPSINVFINDEKIQSFITKFLKDPNSATIFDWIDLASAVLSHANLTESQRKHIEKYLPELIIRLSLATDSSEYLEILKPIVLYHIEYYLNGTSFMKKINSFIDFITQNPIIQKLLSTNTLTIQDLLTLLEPLMKNYIPNQSVRAHLFIYLPQVIEQISKANSTDDYFNILQSVFFTHLQFYLTENSNVTISPVWLTNLFNLTSVQYIFSSDFDNLLLSDFLNVFIEYLGLPLLTNLQKDHLNIYLPDLVFKLLAANSSDEIYTILQPVILSHFEYLLNGSETYLKLESLINGLITDESTRKHLFIYLPNLIEKLSNAQSLNDVLSILEPIVTSHLSLILSNPNTLDQIDVLKYESVQLLLIKLTMDPSSILPSDLINIYIEYMKWPKLTLSQMNHLDKYLPNLLFKVLSENTTDWYSILEPIVSYHLNYYLYQNPDILNNLVNGFLQNSTLIQDFMNLINPFKLISLLNLTESQSNHLLKYIPDFVFNLTQINSTNDLIEMLEPIVLTHLSAFVSDINIDDVEKLIPKVDMYYENLMISLFNKSAGPLLNTSEFMDIVEGLMINLMSGGDSAQVISDLYEQLSAYFMKQLSLPLRFVVEKLSPRIYEYAKDKTDTKVVLAYVVHAGEDLLHKNLITWGIPYDSVYVGVASTTTSQSPLCSTNTPKGIDNAILDILQDLNKQLSDLNKFLGDLSENNNLKPFELDLGGIDY